MSGALVIPDAPRVRLVGPDVDLWVVVEPHGAGFRARGEDEEGGEGGDAWVAGTTRTLAVVRLAVARGWAVREALRAGEAPSSELTEERRVRGRWPAGRKVRGGR